MVLIETVGVGQSETMVNDMVDFFTLLVPPNAGDELQGLKKGIVELCDMVIVNKADGQMLEMANITMTEYLSALKYVRRKAKHWAPRVLKVSSVQETGMDETWEVMMEFYRTALSTGGFEERRRRQRKTWMWRHLTEELIDNIRNDERVQQMVAKLEDGVIQGEIVPNAAAQQILDAYLKR